MFEILSACLLRARIAEVKAGAVACVHECRRRQDRIRTLCPIDLICPLAWARSEADEQIEGVIAKVLDSVNGSLTAHVEVTVAEVEIRSSARYFSPIDRVAWSEIVPHALDLV